MNPRILAATAALLLASCSRQAPGPEGPPAATVEGDTVAYPAGAPQLSFIAVEAAQARRLAVRHLTGRLYLSDDATVRVFTPVAGQVTRVIADVGDRVGRDAPLAAISSPDFGQALADARTADANLAEADEARARAHDLLAHGAAAEKDVEAADAAYGAALAERDRARARLELYHGGPSSTGEAYVLRSPIAGVVVERNINPGQEVRADQMLANATNLFAPLYVVSDTSTLWVQLDAANTDLSDIRTGDEIRVSTDAFPGRTFAGRVTNIAPSLDPSTRAARVRGEVSNPDGTLKAEMYVLADVVRDESAVPGAGVEIPAKAIFTIDQKAYLFVERGPGRFERRQVQAGEEKDGRITVLSGLAPGERVVSEGALLLQSVLEPAD